MEVPLLLLPHTLMCPKEKSRYKDISSEAETSSQPLLYGRVWGYIYQLGECRWSLRFATLHAGVYSDVKIRRKGREPAMTMQILRGCWWPSG